MLNYEIIIKETINNENIYIMQYNNQEKIFYNF